MNKYHYLDGSVLSYYDPERTLHRLDGPAVIYADGDMHWYQNGLFHRLDGPAVELGNGSKVWYKHGKQHRLDGPAVEYVGGGAGWYINGKYFTKEEFEKQILIMQLSGLLDG